MVQRAARPELLTKMRRPIVHSEQWRLHMAVQGGWSVTVSARLNKAAEFLDIDRKTIDRYLSRELMIPQRVWIAYRRWL
jgi:hypothetical protein